jgi:UDP-glucose 4-epimerase
MNILLTGGTGYIASHTAVKLLAAGHQLVLVDNLANSNIAVLQRIEQLSGHRPHFYQADIGNYAALAAIFTAHNIDAVIHFAGLKAVGESTREPLRYYRENVAGSLQLLEVMQEFAVKSLIFSSSATVYGDPSELPLTEQSPIQPQSVYGRTKWMVEQIIADHCQADSSFSAVCLRYFNPVGAHPSGQIGEDPSGIPNNLLPFISQVAIGRRDQLSVFGDDYPTPDGTGVRDYIHVEDLAQGHCLALQLAKSAGCHRLNLGTGSGVSVLEMVNAFRTVSGHPVPLTICPRRAGDVAACYADASKAKQQLGWQAQLTLTDMVTDTWRWQQQNPTGYANLSTNQPMPSSQANNTDTQQSKESQ